MPTIYKDIEIEIDLDDFSDDDLIEELKSRGHEGVIKATNQSRAQRLIETIYQRRRGGQDYQEQLDQLIYEVLGRMS